MSLPIGAEEIARARDNGRRPVDAVIVSLCGRRHEFDLNPQVIVTRSDHDWRFLLGLDAIVCVEPQSTHVPRVLGALARVVRRSVELWDVKAKAGISLYPVWRGADKRELFDLPLVARRDAKFARWERYRWAPSENEEFARP